MGPEDMDDELWMLSQRAEKAEAINADLLAALKRSEQYIHVAIIDGRKQKLSEDLIKMAENDLKMVQIAIVKGES